jgi:hypothetical protein
MLPADSRPHLGCYKHDGPIKPHRKVDTPRREFACLAAGEYLSSKLEAGRKRGAITRKLVSRFSAASAWNTFSCRELRSERQLKHKQTLKLAIFARFWPKLVRDGMLLQFPCIVVKANPFEQFRRPDRHKEVENVRKFPSPRHRSSC